MTLKNGKNEKKVEHRINPNEMESKLEEWNLMK